MPEQTRAAGRLGAADLRPRPRPPGLRGARRRRAADRQRLPLDLRPEPREPRRAGGAHRQAAGDGTVPRQYLDRRPGALGRIRPGRPRPARRRGANCGCANASRAARRPAPIPTPARSTPTRSAALRAGWGHQDFGIYAEVTGGGRVALGDPAVVGMKQVFALAAETDPDALERGRKLFAGPCDFLKGVTAMDALPPADRLEVCFAGRSNVGKSSLINALTGRKALARASNTPGRTQEINFFALGERLLPGGPAGLRLRRGAKAGCRALAGAAAGLSRRPADAAPGVPAHRRAARREAGGRRDHGAC